MGPREHPLFQRFPLDGRFVLSTGEVAAPYHIYDGHGLLLGGFADLAAVQRLLSTEDVVPVQTPDDKTFMAIWLCDFTDASLGPHHELQFSFFVTGHEAEPVSTHPLGVLTTLVTRPDIMMLCSGLWNNTREVVAYNSELLGLNARLSDSRIRREAGRLSFEIADHESGRMLLSGKTAIPKRVSWRAGWNLAGSTGFPSLWRYTRQPWARLRVVGPKGGGFGENRVSETFAKNDVGTIRYFDNGQDCLNIGAPHYAELNFRPQFFQWMEGFKLVFMNPRPMRELRTETG